MSDAINKAEKRGYSRGYTAGRKRLAKDRADDQRRRKENAFWQRAFLATLPWAMAAQGWTFGDTPIKTSDDRVQLAMRVADRALRQAGHRL